MKKKILAMILASITVISMAACGEAKVKTIEGTGSTQTTGTGTENTESGSASETTEDGQADTADCFVFKKGDASVNVNMEINEALSLLGDPDSTFEAKSCAFDGMTMFYTYQGFEIDTYEKGGQDYIATIVITSDLAETAEGITIGDDVSKLDEAYGTDYTGSDNTRVYVKGDSQLTFITKDGVIISIEYLSLTIG